MRPWQVGLLLALACRPDPPTQHDARAAEATAAAETPPPVEAIDRDLDLLLRGGASPDLQARARTHAAAYARRLAARSDAARGDPRHADLDIAAALALLHSHAPDPVARAARAHLDSFSLLLHQPGLDERQKSRVRDQIDGLRVLAGGLDRPLPTTPDPVRPDRICAVATPDGHGLMPEIGCACGDILACSVTRRGATLDLAVHRVPGPQLCDDCYATWTTCTVPRLTRGEQLRLALAGDDLGPLTVTADGLLHAGTCLPVPAQPINQ